MNRENSDSPLGYKVHGSCWKYDARRHNSLLDYLLLFYPEPLNHEPMNPFYKRPRRYLICAPHLHYAFSLYLSLVMNTADLS